MKLNKNYRYILAGVLIIIFSVLIVNALISGTKHSQTNILVNVDGYTMTLQEAIDNNYLKQGAVSPLGVVGPTSISVGHLPSEILVSVDGSEMTLAAAIAGAGLCGSTSIPYTGSINPGHLASEIDIGSKTLQAAIDGGDFCCTDTCSSLGYTCGTYTICGVSVNCGVCEYCGDGTCNNGENYNTCAADCTATYTDPDIEGYYIAAAPGDNSCLSAHWISAQHNAQAMCEWYGKSYISHTISDPFGPGGLRVYDTVWSACITSGETHTRIASVTCGWSA